MDPHLKTKENENEITLDPNEIQICKSFSAVNNRINYFLKRKQAECNDRNTRLYCSESKINHYGASRTCDTISIKRQKKSECFVKRTKVHNTTGPQCNGGIDPASEMSLINNTNVIGPRSDMCERISNIETCLNIKSESINSYKTTTDIYEKLKSLEDKVLSFQNMLLEKNKSSIDISKQEMLLTKHNSVKDPSKPSTNVLPKKSKYTADEIQKLINNIKEY